MKIMLSVAAETFAAQFPGNACGSFVEKSSAATKKNQFSDN